MKNLNNRPDISAYNQLIGFNFEQKRKNLIENFNSNLSSYLTTLFLGSTKTKFKTEFSEFSLKILLKGKIIAKVNFLLPPSDLKKEKKFKEITLESKITFVETLQDYKNLILLGEISKEITNNKSNLLKKINAEFKLVNKTIKTHQNTINALYKKYQEEFKRLGDLVNIKMYEILIKNEPLSFAEEKVSVNINIRNDSYPLEYIKLIDIDKDLCNLEVKYKLENTQSSKINISTANLKKFISNNIGGDINALLQMLGI